MLFWSHFPRERPRCETHGGHSRSDIAPGPSITCIRPDQGTGSRRQLTGGPFQELASSRVSPHHTTLNDHIKYKSSKRRHGVLKDGKKRRNQNRIKFLIALLWGAHSGGERESAGKKQGEEIFVPFLRCSGRIFFGSDPITRHTGAKAA